jgi:cysteine synthase A
VIVEPTSGNTGIALCALAAARGYGCILVMPDNMSAERIRLMESYGAQIVLTPGAQGMNGAVEKARQIAGETPNSFLPDQFRNPANPAAHYQTTGPEIWTQSGECIDLLVAGVGTGGTLTGAGRYLKERRSSIRIVAVEPAESPLLSLGFTGSHSIQGIGANFLPQILDRELIDEVIAVSSTEAKLNTRLLARQEGLLAGISSGAALTAAITLARRQENAGKTISLILPDTGSRYLSMT